MKLGQCIKNIRNRLGYTQKELAEKAFISRSYLADVEKDRYHPSLSTLEKISDALGVSLGRLTGDAASSIIEGRLEEIGMTLSELAEKAQVPLQFLNNLDDVDPMDYAYAYMTSISKTLGLPPGKLIAALANQEPPAYDGPTSSAAEDFAESFKEPANSKFPSLTPKDEREIARDLETMLNNLDDKNGMAAYNDPDDQEDRELLKNSLLTSMRIAKQIAKKKFTPKKYRKE